MFGKLRLKLALMNMVVAGLIILAIAVVAYFFISWTVARQSEQAIGTIARDLLDTQNAGDLSPAESIGRVGGLYPYLVLRIDTDGQMTMAPFRTHLSQGQMTELASRALAMEKDFFDNLSKQTGTANPTFFIARHAPSSIVRISDGESFRYSIVGSRQGDSVYMIFLDMQQEDSLLGSVRLALGGSVLGGLLLTLLGGLFLAGRALRPVRASWQKQRNFVADASHELRSPLAAIRCNLDVVLDDLNAPVIEKQPYWEGISEETARMTVLVDELLLLARADSDAIVLERKRVELAPVAENAVTFLQPVAAKRGVSLELETAGLPAVTGDQARLKQVMIALIDNAIKYTPEGGKISVKIRKSKDRAVIEVADTGIGIPKEQLSKIFERFYRVDKARERESGGHGLGLSIAQWIVQQLGGSISVASEEGKGSCFTVSLPLLKE